METINPRAKTFLILSVDLLRRIKTDATTNKGGEIGG
jgi:hypothetical protein